MDNDELQEEQVKKFIKEYGPWIVAGLVIGLGSMFTWRNYQAAQDSAAQAKTSAYEQVLEQLQSSDGLANTEFANTALTEFEGSSYAALTRMQLAAIAVNDGDLDEAAQLLSMAIKETSRVELQSLISLRLARVEIARGEFELAQKALANVANDGFTALKKEVEGDLLFAQGQLSAAKTAYAQAIGLSASGANPFLQMKLDNLAAN